MIYSSNDVFLASSRYEAFGKTITEAMACETPVVAYDNTGPNDIIDHKANGYKAAEFDVSQLADGVDWVLKQSDSYMLSREARVKILAGFDLK